MARHDRRGGIRGIPVSQVKYDLSRYLHEAEGDPVVILRHGKAAGVLIGFESEKDFPMESDSPFLALVQKARATLHARRGIRGENHGKKR